MTVGHVVRDSAAAEHACRLTRVFGVHKPSEASIWDVSDSMIKGHGRKVVQLDIGGPAVVLFDVAVGPNPVLWDAWQNPN